MKINLKRDQIFAFIIIIIFLIFGTFVYRYYMYSTKASNKDTSSIDINIVPNTTDENIDWNTYDNNDYTLKESLLVTTEGVHNLTGKINGNITVDSTGDVKLVLDNLYVKSNNGPAIYIKNAKTVVIELKDNTTSYLEDDSSYTNYTNYGVIYSNCDLTFMGNGSLKIVSNKTDGIVSSGNLKFLSGTYEVNAKNDGLVGNNSVYIVDGNYTINSLGTGIKSTSKEEEQGYILIEQGTFNINSTLDGISSNSKLLIKDGTYDITTGSGSDNSSTVSSGWGMWSSDKTLQSAKGLKSQDNLVIENGTFNLNTSDDAIYSYNYLGIADGKFEINSGDDGIHADNELIVDKGTINIYQSYEGLEGIKVTINGGDISVSALDDGINIGGGKDLSSISGRAGQNTFINATKKVLTINGGNINLYTIGDGIDANGSVYITGGNTTIYGPTSINNSVINYNNVFSITGGTIVAGGSNYENILTTSNDYYNVNIIFDKLVNKDSIVTILNSNNEEIFSYTSYKSFNLLFVSSKDLINGETYTIKIDGEVYKTFTIETYTTIVDTLLEVTETK